MDVYEPRAKKAHIQALVCDPQLVCASKVICALVFAPKLVCALACAPKLLYTPKVIQELMTKKGGWCQLCRIDHIWSRGEKCTDERTYKF